MHLLVAVLPAVVDGHLLLDVVVAEISLLVRMTDETVTTSVGTVVIALAALTIGKSVSSVYEYFC